MIARDQAQMFTEKLGKDVDRILADEARGNKEAFAHWLHTFYLGGLDGERLDDFAAFMKSPLVLDMIADWQHECTDRASRTELLDHIRTMYAADDFDESEHYNEDGQPIPPYGESDDKHYDEHGTPIPPYVPSFQRRTTSDEN